jgi:hypothetical protein
VDDPAVGFQAHQTRLSVSGNVIDENWGYFIQFDFARDGGEATLLDAYVTHQMENGWNIMFGQFKLPLVREELVSDKYQLAASRSPMNESFNQGRSQGIQVGMEADTYRFMAAFSDGVMAANTDYISGAEADFAFTGRFEYKWAGDWTQFRDFTSFPNSDFAGMAGIAAHYQTGGETLNTLDVDALVVTLDVSVEGNGWNAFGAFTYADVDAGGVGGGEATDMAFLLQGGFFATPQLEIFGRFDMVMPDDDRPAGEDENFSTFTAGVNYYFVPESHTAKFTAQLIYFLDQQNESIVEENTSIPLLAADEDGQFSVLAQFQLVF